jgi:hypothetical protein
MDTKHLRPGTTLYRPVGVEGARFSVGDTHAAMGDGEVCGTAVETAMDISLRLTVRRDLQLTAPQYHIAAGVARTEASPTTSAPGVAGELMEASRGRAGDDRTHPGNRRALDREEAYALALWLRPAHPRAGGCTNWVVGAFLPRTPRPRLTPAAWRRVTACVRWVAGLFEGPNGALDLAESPYIARRSYDLDEVSGCRRERSGAGAPGGWPG